VVVEVLLASDVAGAVSVFQETSTILHGFVRMMRWLPFCYPWQGMSKPTQALLCN
jgi:hypothetical protein